MANASSAFGDITIVAKTPQILSDFIYLHNKADAEAYYNTTLSDLENLNRQEIHEIVKKQALKESNENYYELTTPFSAIGRNVFRINIDWFFDLFKEDFNLKDVFNDTDRKLIKMLKNEKFTVTFEVTDYSPAQDFIETYKKRIAWNPEKQERVEIDENDSEYMSHTATNLLAKNIYETGDVWDTEYIINNYDYFVEEVSKSLCYGIINNILDNKESFKQYLETRQNSSVYYEIEEWLDALDYDNELTEFFENIG